MPKDTGAEHVYTYYMFRLGEADYSSKYDATPNHLNRAWHVGGYYYHKLMWTISSLG